MSWNAYLWWGGAAVLGGLVACFAWHALSVRRARRFARSFRPPPPTELRWDPEGAGPDAPLAGIPPAFADFVRRDAEQAALRAAAAGTADPPNPHPHGTPEFVLWVASYHLAMTHLDDTVPPPAPARDAAVNPP